MDQHAGEMGTLLYDAMAKQVRMLDDFQLEKLLHLVAGEAGRRLLPDAVLLHDVERKWETQRLRRA